LTVIGIFQISERELNTEIFELRDVRRSWRRWNSWDCLRWREFQAAGQRWTFHLLWKR